MTTEASRQYLPMLSLTPAQVDYLTAQDIIDSVTPESIINVLDGEFAWTVIGKAYDCISCPVTKIVEKLYPTLQGQVSTGAPTIQIRGQNNIQNQIMQVLRAKSDRSVHDKSDLSITVGQIRGWVMEFLHPEDYALAPSDHSWLDLTTLDPESTDHTTPEAAQHE